MHASGMPDLVQSLLRHHTLEIKKRRWRFVHFYTSDTDPYDGFLRLSGNYPRIMKIWSRRLESRLLFSWPFVMYGCVRAIPTYRVYRLYDYTVLISLKILN